MGAVALVTLALGSIVLFQQLRAEPSGDATVDGLAAVRQELDRVASEVGSAAADRRAAAGSPPSPEAQARADQLQRASRAASELASAVASVSARSSGTTEWIDEFGAVIGGMVVCGVLAAWALLTARRLAGSAERAAGRTEATAGGTGNASRN